MNKTVCSVISRIQSTNSHETYPENIGENSSGPRIIKEVRKLFKEKKHEKSFIEIKYELENPTNLDHFNPQLESIIPFDMPTFGLGATLKQVDPEKNRKVIAY